MTTARPNLAAGTALLLLAFGVGSGGDLLASVPPEKHDTELREEGVNGLKLTLHADRSETIMNPDGKGAAPVALELVFTNVSARPIKLNLHAVPYAHIGTMKIMRQGKPVICYAWNQMGTPYRPSDFPVLQPGTSVKRHLTKVGDRLQPGLYTIQIDYYNVLSDQDKKAGAIYSDSWTGKINSEVFSLTVKPRK